MRLVRVGTRSFPCLLRFSAGFPAEWVSDGCRWSDSLGLPWYHPLGRIILIVSGTVNPGYPQTGKIWTYTEEWPPGALQCSRGAGRSSDSPRPPSRRGSTRGGPLRGGRRAGCLRGGRRARVATGSAPAPSRPRRPGTRLDGAEAPRRGYGHPWAHGIAAGGPGRIPRESGKGPPHRGDRRPR